MIRFKTLLYDEGVDPTEVQLVRHQKKNYPGRQPPYQRWVG